MDHLGDELDLRHHRGLKPEVYYRCPALESLDGALQNELQKNLESLIPVEIVTEFVFAIDSTITIPVAQQATLGALGIAPADCPQSITVDQALCRGIDGQDRVLPQRAVARSILEVIQGVDGFRYTERQAWGKDGDDGIKFKYVCVDSVQNRRSHARTKKAAEEPTIEVKRHKSALPTYDCGGAVHIKFSEKRDAINVVYKHNPIHRDVESRPTYSQNGHSKLPALQDDDNGTTKPRKRNRKNAQAEEANGLGDAHPDMATSPETNNSPTKKRRRTNGAASSPEDSRTQAGRKQKKGKQPGSPFTSRSPKNQSIPEAGPPPTVALPTPENPPKGPCVRCRERKIKCNEVQPTCNQCQRGLWTCQYPTFQPKRTRSTKGCLNCRQRNRKCTEEVPSCAYCIKIDEDCEYT